MPRNKARRWLLQLDPILAAALYVGFITMAIVTVIIYARFLNEENEKQDRQENEKIIIATISGCQRANDIRKALTDRDIAIDKVIGAHITHGDLSRPVVELMLDIIEVETDLAPINCQRDIRQITSGLLKDVEDRGN